MDRDMTIYQIVPHRILGHRSGGALSYMSAVNPSSRRSDDLQAPTNETRVSEIQRREESSLTRWDLLRMALCVLVPSPETRFAAAVLPPKDGRILFPRGTKAQGAWKHDAAGCQYTQSSFRFGTEAAYDPGVTKANVAFLESRNGAR
jgi:hypothetical protein